jgi:hypothetical protein
LLLRGGFQPAPDDALPALPDGRPADTLVMVGNAGPAMWRAFSASPQALDGQPHPLNRWTRHHVDAIAQAAGGVALYPFDVTPVWPFQRWAARAEPVFPSPLGLLIHPQYGLWHAYRFALIFSALDDADRADLRAQQDQQQSPQQESPCLRCVEQLCLTSCPANAFDGQSFAVAACASHLHTPAGQSCMQGGCRARNACPVAAGLRYSPAQAAFHMAAFARARG